MGVSASHPASVAACGQVAAKAAITISAMKAASIPVSAAVTFNISGRRTPGDGKVSDDLKLLESFWRPESSMLTSISYCQAATENRSTAYFMHDFLVIQMHNQRRLFVQAEKISGPETGIRVFRVEEIPPCEILHVIKIESQISLSHVLDVLLDHDPSYNAFTNNCWNYALGTAARLISRVCLDFDPSSDECLCLQHEAKVLDDIVRKNHYHHEGTIVNLAANVVGLGDEFGARLQNMVPKFCGP